MSANAGNLLWRRMRIALPGSTGGGGHPSVPSVTDVDTGIAQASQSFDATEPPLDGSTVGSRIQVIPLAPWALWSTILISDPVLDPTTGTVHVTFTNTGSARTIVALIWDPHSVIGPGQADQYNPIT